MPRAKQITRTIKSAKVTVLCLDTVSAEPFNETVILSGDFKTDEKMLKAVQKKIDTDTVKAVKVVNVEFIETLYGMSEETFMANATELPPRASKN